MAPSTNSASWQEPYYVGCSWMRLDEERVRIIVECCVELMISRYRFPGAKTYSSLRTAEIHSSTLIQEIERDNKRI